MLVGERVSGKIDAETAAEIAAVDAEVLCQRQAWDDARARNAVENGIVVGYENVRREAFRRVVWKLRGFDVINGEGGMVRPSRDTLVVGLEGKPVLLDQGDRLVAMVSDPADPRFARMVAEMAREGQMRWGDNLAVIGGSAAFREGVAEAVAQRPERQTRIEPGHQFRS